MLINEGEPSAHRAAGPSTSGRRVARAAAHVPLDVPYTARRPIGEYHGDDARCMGCGTLIPLGQCVRRLSRAGAPGLPDRLQLLRMRRREPIKITRGEIQRGRVRSSASSTR